MVNQYSCKITITLPHGLLRLIDEAASYNYATRSDVIRQALVVYLQQGSAIGNVKDAMNEQSVSPQIMSDEPGDYLEIQKKHPHVARDDVELLQFLKEYKDESQPSS